MTSPAQAVWERNASRMARQGVGPIRSIPDTELVDVLIRLGVPKFRAVELHWNPEKRLATLELWCLEQDARDGDRDARGKLEVARAMLARQRQEELISDDPTRGHTDLIDPRVLLA
jgi:hypothetical protein